MYCRECGKQIADDARFCGHCGASTGGPAQVPPDDASDATMGVPPVPAHPAAPVPPPAGTAHPSVTPPPSSPAPPSFTTIPPPPTAPSSAPGSYGTGGYGGYSPPPAPPKQSRTALWIGIAIAAVIIIAAAVTIPLLVLADDDDEVATSTTSITTTTSTEGPESTTTTAAASSTTTTSESTTTTTEPSGPPGDSDGDWVEVDAPTLPAGAIPFSAVVSEEALLVRAQEGDSFRFYAYLFGSGELLELPIDASESWGEDLDGLMAVWWEGDFDDETYESYNEHIYAYLLPDGPKVEVIGGDRQPFSPQVAGGWVAWTEGEPWEMNPEEYSAQRIYAVEIDSAGRPTGQPIELVSLAPAFILGDSMWVYSLSPTHLAWENQAPHHSFDAGTYVMDITGDLLPQKLGTEAWRPSIGGDTVVYWDDTLIATDLATMDAWTLDPEGDFATAGPTYAAYYRFKESGDSWTHEIVVKGYGGGHEQVLAETEIDPYFSAPIATSATRMAVIVDDTLRIFEWQAQGR